jgi:hypothetical protein
MSFFDSIPEPPPPDPAHGGASRTIIGLADDPDAGPA